MTREEAIEILTDLQDGNVSEYWYRENVKEAIAIAIDALEREGRRDDEFDGMIFSTDKYMAFIDKKDIHIMRKDSHKITVERMFNTEEDDE